MTFELGLQVGTGVPGTPSRENGKYREPQVGGPRSANRKLWDEWGDSRIPEGA